MSESGSRFFSCNLASFGFGGVCLSLGRFEPGRVMDSSSSVGWSVLLCVGADESGVEAGVAGEGVDEAGEEEDKAGEDVDKTGEGAGFVDVFLCSCLWLVVVISVVLVGMTGSLRMNLFFLVGFDGESSRFWDQTL